MPVPASARSVSRVSNWAVRAISPSTSSGIPKSARIARRTFLAAGSAITIEKVPLGSALSSRVSIRIDICGAWAAAAKALITSPERWDFGAVRWNAWPSRSGWWAMWSIAAATKSTGTMFV